MGYSIKSGLSITNGFKRILSEGRKPEKFWVDRGSEFYNKTFKSLFKEYETGKTASGIELYSTYSDLKAVFIERFNRTLLIIINKPMFINGDGRYIHKISMGYKSGLSITNGFKRILSEGRKPEKFWVDRGSEFYKKTFKSLFKEYETGKTASGIELYSTYSDLKAVFIERFNRTLLIIINKPMFINGDGRYIHKISMGYKSGLSITNGFKRILSEGRKPEKFWVDRDSEFYNKTFKSLFKEYETGKTASGIELCSTYSDLKAVFIEKFNRTLLNIINKPMFINGDGNWVNILNDAVVTYNNNIHSTIKMTPVDASNNPDKVEYTFSFQNFKVKPGYAQPKLKVGDYVRNADKRNIFSKGYTSNWNRELFKVNEVLKTQPLKYKIEDINVEIIEGKYYEQELLKSEFDFESNNKVLESLNIDLRSARK